ncbi:O-methyltransferase [Erwinia mallotivora]|uniref:O-methyltransferase n=1 Tax=Erwinia mallotivora TaxID=69222 RepID=UPI0035EB85EE
MSGTAYKIIMESLGGDKDFSLFREGKLTQKDYFERVSHKKDSLTTGEFNEDMLNLSARMPKDPVKYADNILSDLFEKGIIPSKNYNRDKFSEIEDLIASNFMHEGRKTFIFPEEARIIFALADICKPKKIAFMGSYYAFWAIWILPVLPAESTVWLMDIDHSSQALAKENIQKLSLHSEVEIIHSVEDAIKDIRSVSDLDWIVLDAEGPKMGVDDEDMIDKAIYYPMIREGYSSLKENGLMIAHNILLENTTNSPYIEDKIIWNKRMFRKFIPFISENFKDFVHFESTEGMGIAKK